MMTQLTANESTSVGTALAENSVCGAVDALVESLVDDWRRWLGVQPTIFDGESGAIVVRGLDQPIRDALLTAEMARQVARGGRVEVIEFDEPLAVVAVPVNRPDGQPLVGVACFVCGHVANEPSEERCARLLGLDGPSALDWVRNQATWTVDAIVRTAEIWQAKWVSDRRADSHAAHIDDLSEQITATYEEIAMLYRLLRSLDVSRDVRDLAADIVDWLSDVVPSQGLAISITTAVETDAGSGETEPSTAVFAQGDWPLPEPKIGPAVESLVSDVGEPVVLNRSSAGGLLPPEIRSLVRVPVARGPQFFGWLAAINHVDESKEFGTVECELLTSVATILATHLANVELFRTQSDLFAGVVRALSSSIDAKDPYTCGHSDRVARVAVRLGRELGCDAELLKTIYLSGLLHDIGKIGIDDHVLRKPGRLTEEEFEHIKTHPETGYRILLGIPHLKQVLPGVRYHHESYDGTGYPQQLAGDEIPFLGRLIAVADAFDAMSSDRPYRKGLDDEKIDDILRTGAGQQWDPCVVAAFFAARDDVREIAQTAPSADVADTVSWP